ncbi:MAG: glutamine synthetase beta-grasp domain-containing protein, partial [Pirellulaceae bacterium]|nr:glutamine synthetase beta-grasp domain-containing protein [Pirellulaceae bacterium]
MSYKLEYIWLDGYQPEPNLRSKTKVVSSEPGDPSDCPEWGFDGSSTEQAAGDDSDCLLKPVRLAPDPARRDGFLVLCEVLSADTTPHSTNIRSTFEDDEDFWFGFEQEYTLMLNGLPLGFPADGYPGPQGPYYCSVGTDNWTAQTAGTSEATLEVTDDGPDGSPALKLTVTE